MAINFKDGVILGKEFTRLAGSWARLIVVDYRCG